MSDMICKLSHKNTRSHDHHPCTLLGMGENRDTTDINSTDALTIHWRSHSHTRIHKHTHDPPIMTKGPASLARRSIHPHLLQAPRSLIRGSPTDLNGPTGVHEVEDLVSETWRLLADACHLSRSEPATTARLSARDGQPTSGPPPRRHAYLERQLRTSTAVRFGRP